jgi:hypothetical protein
MAWIPHYEEVLIVPLNMRIHYALARRSAPALDTDKALNSIPTDFGLGSIDAAVFHLRPRAQRTAQMSKVETQNYMGVLERGGLNIHG